MKSKVLLAAIVALITLSFARADSPRARKTSNERKETKMILGLRTVMYHVDDLNKARDWYTQVLGFKPYFDEPFYVGFFVGGFELGLLPDATPGTVGPQPLWGVADIGLACSRLIELGASPLEPITEVGGIKVAAVVDPFGNRFGVIENPHFSASAVR